MQVRKKVRSNQDIELAVFSKLFQAEVAFKSQSGRFVFYLTSSSSSLYRWIHMEDGDGSNTIEYENKSSATPGGQVDPSEVAVEKVEDDEDGKRFSALEHTAPL